jgi:hypothetical protein
MVCAVYDLKLNKNPLKIKSRPTLRRATFNLNLITIKLAEMPIHIHYIKHYTKINN